MSEKLAAALALLDGIRRFTVRAPIEARVAALETVDLDTHERIKGLEARIAKLEKTKGKTK